MTPSSGNVFRDLGFSAEEASQPRVSNLLRGRLHLFSIETLIDMLGRLGVQVRFVVKPSPRKRVA